MGEFELAYDDLTDAYEIYHENQNEFLLGDRHRLAEEIFQRIAIEQKFGLVNNKDLRYYKTILQILLLQDGLPVTFHLGIEDNKVIVIDCINHQKGEQAGLHKDTFCEFIGR